MTLRLGIIGLSPGNGHPYSWAAICNGFDSEAMACCGFPSIPAYLAKHRWPDEYLQGARVTNVWAQDPEEAARIARAARIEQVVTQPEEMIGEIDGLLLARDDAQNHLRFAEPFLKAGIPVYIDKPVAISEAAFDQLHDAQVRPGQIFSCSAMRFAPEMNLEAPALAELGEVRWVCGTTPKYWPTYAIHLIDPLLMLMGHETRPERLFSGTFGRDGRFLALRYPEGVDVHLVATGTLVSLPISLRVIGTKGEITLRLTDSFGAFKATLAEFVSSVREGRSRLSEEFNRRATQIIEMGSK